MAAGESVDEWFLSSLIGVLRACRNFSGWTIVDAGFWTLRPDRVESVGLYSGEESRDSEVSEAELESMESKAAESSLAADTIRFLRFMAGVEGAGLCVSDGVVPSGRPFGSTI
jgi:hypothetical protein